MIAIVANKINLPEPFGVPVSRLLMVAVAALGIVLLAGLGLFGLGRLDSAGALAAVVGGWSAVGVSLASLLAIAPWKPRTALAWQSLWIASTAMRLVLTPAVLASVYFAALLPGGALFLGGAAGYGLALLGEALVIVSAVPRNPPSGG